ncbi:MAG: DNA-protecting protein DprA [Candidatus Sericytochromatia bacterium]|nr:DNA-protecting protein DprA [Candidatus Sericytochromatia bacterium]
MADELAYWLAWHRIPQMGAVRLRRLHATFGSLRHAWEASPAAIGTALGMAPEGLAACLQARKLWPPDDQQAALTAAGLSAVCFADDRYPARLRELHDAPPLLYHAGTWCEMPRAVAIVGTRRATTYGREVAFRLAGDLAAAGVVVVSGLAAGIDAAAHSGAISRGRTVAVMACSPELVYPPGHRRLHGEICGSGMVVAEYPPGTKPEPGRFPARNRLISGLCAAVVVVEAGARSGALITADFAGEQGREVFAVPGPITSPASAGTHQLIRGGATLIGGAQEILDELGWSADGSDARPEDSLVDLTKDERHIYTQLNEQPQHFDALLRRSGSHEGALAAVLLSLELKGRARQLAGHQFVRGS